MNPIDFRKELTARIIRQLEEGTAPWVKTWDGAEHLGMPYNAVSKRPYHGGNCLWLQCQSYDDPRWCTYKQAQQQGWQVDRGEKATVVEYWQWEELQKDESGQSIRVKLDQPRVFYAHIFNAQQMKNVPALKVSHNHEWQPEEAAERIMRTANPKLLHDQLNRAFYSPGRDEIHLPARDQFPSSKMYYSVVLHELGHWTGHHSRLDRDLANTFGSDEYAREELRAELSSFFLSAHIGIPHDPTQHAAYIQSWIKVLHEDHNEIFRAAKEAERITEYVLEFQKEKRLQHDPANPQCQVLEEELEC